ncbi:efflux RND transporter permease subunit [Sphingobacterium psychroaquaticum]|uniref:Hydrophobic/amphiphilic exporter-1, HAE1 family n=1 Tax=Sphingobacterium psychroaquaticum TaxID=561061 RepID=A0A1X7IB14_9SPHI|nr:efflux RND transporter permease subunit [Sphingobacterium psychroaquaticum]SMG11675.1 hydrophobic/amphiphilic exporter-1, HAE1 family [Sphingobacterium psychroaquaticum]
MFKKFINRPVLATVISVILIILGILGLYKLPLQQFPDIAPPSVLVTALYPGANAETVLRAVAPSLEESINGVENMSYMTSTASNDGSLSIMVYFKLGTDPDQAAVNVQNRVAQATNQLPEEVVKAGITTNKQQNSLLMVVSLYAEDDKSFDETFLANYAQINIIPEIKRISGVGQAMVFGGNKDYAMRIWLNPTQMTTYNLTPDEVTAAIQDKNLEAAPGKFGESSTESFEYIIKYKGKLNKAADYENIIIRSNPDGSVLRLKDVAKVELGSYTYGSSTKVNGKPGINIGTMQLAGSNASEIQVAIDQLMQKAAKDFPKGVEYLILYNTKDALDQSINQVIKTLLEAFVLVFLVVFIFLQDFRSTLIPAIAVPVAILGTFFFMLLFGFSINLLTLFALILAIGIVVDDAIVVVEAVHSKMEHSHLPPKEATTSAMGEITGAIISITLVMAAVFLPVGFMEGSTGVFYRQFALTLAIAIIISAVNALTLSPALAALFLKEPVHHENNGPAEKKTFKQKFFIGFNRGFDNLTSKYLGGIQLLIRYKWVSMAGLVLITLATVVLVNRTKTGFIPSEDQGFMAISVSMPGGTSLDRTIKTIDEAERILMQLPSAKTVNAMSGFNVMTQSTNPSSGVIFLLLKPAKERGPISDINAIMAEVNQKLSVVKGVNFFVFTFPTVPGFSNVDGLDMVLQDKTGGSLNKFSDIGNQFICSLMQRPEIAMAFTTFKADYPQYNLEVDELKAAQLQVNVKDILRTMQVYFGSSQATDFNRFGKYYRVMMQAQKDDRANLTTMEGVFVKNRLGQAVPINTLVTLHRVYGPETASRYNLFNSISINAIAKPGYSSGDAIKAVEEVAAQQLPAGYNHQFSGMTKEELSSGGQSAIIFGLSLLFIYLLLAAQYESYILPLAVILSIPTGVLGVFIAIGLTGLENNIYVQVALVMLIGLLAKNAILIVEFALQRRRTGESLLSSVVEASRLRLRPIIMTSVAFIAGLIPMMNVKGPSAMGNHSISIGAAGGMLSGVILGLFIIPVLFVLFQYLQEKISGKPIPQVKDQINDTI